MFTNIPIPPPGLLLSLVLWINVKLDGNCDVVEVSDECSQVSVKKQIEGLISVMTSKIRSKFAERERQFSNIHLLELL